MIFRKTHSNSTAQGNAGSAHRFYAFPVLSPECILIARPAVSCPPTHPLLAPDSSDLAYCLVHSLAVCIAAGSSSFQRCATSFASGSSGLGAPSSACIERRMVRICKAGDQLPGCGINCNSSKWGRDILLSTSKQMRPSLSMLGW